MTQEQAFEKWWERTGGGSGNGDSRSAFLAGAAFQQINQLGILADIRKAVGDPTGRLMQSELLERVKQLVADAAQHQSWANAVSETVILLSKKEAE